MTTNRLPVPSNEARTVLTVQTSIVHVKNLHCSSCVNSIETALSALQPQPLEVKVSIVQQSVLVKHNVALHESEIRAAIAHQGFDVVSDRELYGEKMVRGDPSKHLEYCSVCRRQALEQPSDTEGKGSISIAGPSSICTIVLSIGGMTCASCSKTVTETVLQVPGVLQASVNLLGNSATIEAEHANVASAVRSAIEDVGYEATIVNTTSSSLDHASFNAVYSVGGMTCSSCVNAIKEVVGGLPGVSEVTVSLLDHSASVRMDRQDLADVVRNAIEDCGFEASLVSIRPVDGAVTPTEPGSRTVSLSVEGMFCQHCPPKVLEALQVFETVNVQKEPTLADPVLIVTYVPDLPTLSIRTIMQHIDQASPAFKTTVYHPPTVEERAQILQRREQRSYLVKLFVTFVIAIPTFIIGIVYMTLVKDGNKTKEYLMQPMWAGNASRIEWALLFLATPVMFYSAAGFHRRSLKELRALWRPGSTTPLLRRFTRFGSMNLLISSGVSVAYFSSVALLALAATQEHSMQGKGDTLSYFDSVVFLTMFLLAGRYMEAYSKARTADAISALSSLRPLKALLVVNEPATLPKEPLSSLSSFQLDLEKATNEEASALSTQLGSRIDQVPVDQLEVGDIVRVLSGSTPPADGVIVNGEHTSFDESSLTGESRPIEKYSGDTVFLGTINTGNVVHVKVTMVGGTTMLDNIVKVVREGQTRRAPMERVADNLTAHFVPVVTLLAVLTFVIWLALGMTGSLPADYLDRDVGGWPLWSLEFGIAVFVVACPCGIGLAAPTALLVGSGLAAKFGILARGGGEAFQEMASVDVVVFDKTGTLTYGSDPKVTECEFHADLRLPEADILSIAVELESTTSHPLAIAIRDYCSQRGSRPLTGEQFHEQPGRGLRAYFPELSCTAIIGNEAWMDEHRVQGYESLSPFSERWKQEGKSIVVVALCLSESVGEPTFAAAAIFAVADIIRPEAPEVIQWMKKQSISTWMLSGDNIVTASAVAALVGIDPSHVIAGVLPHEKAEHVARLQKKNSLARDQSRGRTIVAFCGDGVNDSPALTAADVGIAVGSGSDVAVSSASFVILSSKLTGLAVLVDLSRAVIRRVKFNFIWAIMYNVAMIPLAAGVIYPATGHPRLSPVWASLAMALSSISVISSSLLLKLYRQPRSTN